MAGLKKPKKRDNSNPNTVLVVFLVFFVLLAIGLGVWGYYGYAGQAALETKAKNATNAQKAAQNAQYYFNYVALELKSAITGNLDANEDGVRALERDKFNNPEGPYKAEESRPGFVTTFETMKKELGYDEAGKKYVNVYQKLFKDKEDEVAKIKTELAAKVAENKDFTKKYADIDAAYKNQTMLVNNMISTGNANVLKIYQNKLNEIETAHVQNKKLIQQLKDEADKQAIEIERREVKIQEKDLIIAKMQQQLNEVGVANPGAGGGGGESQPHALLLDYSPGKPLWDNPVGKILRVEPDRQVVIDLGSSDGVQPELTFTIFGAMLNRKNRSAGPMKGTIEVIRVIDSKTSLARVTSLFDYEGRELPLSGNYAGRLQAESENAMKEGDLLFNVTWGSHVAVAGLVNVSGNVSNSPIDQKRNLFQFLSLIERQGITVDAYLDPNDGSIQGKVTAKSRFLIMGEGVKAPAPPERELTDAEKAQYRLVNNIAENMKRLRAEAIERGMFIISPANYANLVGYRAPRSFTSQELTGVRPRAPFSNTLIGFGGPRPAAEAQPPVGEIPPPMQPKEPEVKNDN